MKELISEERIKTRVKELAGEISEKYRGRTPILIGVLNGSFIFLADLVRELSIDCEVDFLKISSYEGTQSTGTVHLLKDISADITGRDVIIIEDVIDSGLTMNFLKTRLEGANPASLAITSLLFKKEIAKLNFKIDFIGFEIPADYVIGYGLDLDQKKRNLKSIFRIEQ